MNSRFYDILSLIAAVMIVIIIAFVMKPGLFSDTSGGDKEAVVSQSSQYQDVSETVESGSELLSAGSLYTKSEQKWTIASRISGAMDYYEPATRNFAVRYISEENSGEFTIAQACDIWDNAVDEWTYAYDKYGIWDASPASTTINTGLSGDSNDFAVFVASLIKAVGGQARIKLAASQQSGEHTYAELYLGNSDDFNTPVINADALSELKSNYPYAFSNDPSGLNVFKYEHGSICSGDSCWYYVKPFEQILNEPEKYGKLCYQYPKLIDYLLLFPDTSVIEFQMMYIEMRYSGYNAYSSGVFTLRDIPYTSEIESDGTRSYWLKLDMSGNYPGDSNYVDSGYSTVFYSDASWKDINFMTLYG